LGGGEKREREKREGELFFVDIVKCERKRTRRCFLSSSHLSSTSTSPTSLPNYSEAFDLFDTDGSSAIDAKELTVAMR